MTFNLKDILAFFIILIVVTIGTLIYASIPTYHCPKCNTNLGVYTKQKYCSECGQKLDTMNRYSVWTKDK